MIETKIFESVQTIYTKENPFKYDVQSLTIFEKIAIGIDEIFDYLGSNIFTFAIITGWSATIWPKIQIGLGCIYS